MSSSPAIAEELKETNKTDLDRIQEAEEKLGETEDAAKRVQLLHYLGVMEYMQSNGCPREEGRLNWLNKSYNRLKEAHSMQPKNGEILCNLASTTGRLAEESDFRTKIRLGFEFKSYLDLAISLDEETDPDHTFQLCHMRGRLAYTVLTLPPVEKFFATTLGIVPSFELDDALKDLRKAQSLHPDMAENELFLAKCLILKGDVQAAIKCLQSTVACESEYAIEDDYIQEAKKLLDDLLSI